MIQKTENKTNNERKYRKGNIGRVGKRLNIVKQKRF